MKYFLFLTFLDTEAKMAHASAFGTHAHITQSKVNITATDRETNFTSDDVSISCEILPFSDIS